MLMVNLVLLAPTKSGVVIHKKNERYMQASIQDCIKASLETSRLVDAMTKYREMDIVGHDSVLQMERGHS